MAAGVETSAQLSRRQVLPLTVAAAAAAVGATIARASVPASTSIKAIGFDAFVIFDPRPIFTLAEDLFPGKGAALSNLWRTRQFEYTWLRTLTGHYADFWQVTQDALVFAAAAYGLELTADKRDRLMQAYLSLEAYPDVLPGLQMLRSAGIRLAFLTNWTERMLEASVASAGLDGLFELRLSTDRVRAYKPDPRAYQMAIDAFALSREKILFAAFGGWDAAGGKSFGYRTFWVNRLKLPTEELEARPDAIGDTVTDLVHFVLAPG
jgi:2-haloacid dehalogenase